MIFPFILSYVKWVSSLQLTSNVLNDKEEVNFFQELSKGKSGKECDKITWIHRNIKQLGENQYFLFYSHKAILANSNTTKTDH